VTLVVNNTTTPSTVGGFSPPSGTYLAQLNITLGNVGVSKAISASFQNFTLQTDQSLVLQFSTASDLVGTPCSMSVSVANGGTFTCNLVFEVPTGQTPVTVLYDDAAGDTASAGVPAPQSYCALFDSMKASTACADCLNKSTCDPGIDAGEALAQRRRPRRTRAAHSYIGALAWAANGQHARRRIAIALLSLMKATPLSGRFDLKDSRTPT
jgi:hypothetical protein